MPALTILMMCACGSPEQPSSKGAPPAPGEAVAKSAALPDNIVLFTKQGTVTLPHLAHAKRLNCATCHSEIQPGKTSWDKDTVHSYCRDCHITNGGGPTTCVACHKK
jgi:hypothetical protein